MRHTFILLLAAVLPFVGIHSADMASYTTESEITYCTVDGKALTLNAFLPPKGDKPVPAIVHIHGGWWTGGRPSGAIKGGMFKPIVERGYAVFSIRYRLGANGGFPQNIRDCRNAIRFVRKNAARFNIDPNRIGTMGGSAGGHLTMMTAVVPADFNDGGPTAGLEGVSAQVQAAFAWIGPTNLATQWDDSVTGKPSDSRKYHKVLFHGATPETAEGRKEYLRNSPASYVRKDLPPMLVCDGELDPIVPKTPGRAYVKALQEAGAPARYWMTPKGKHGFPKGPEFQKLYEELLGSLRD